MVLLLWLAHLLLAGAVALPFLIVAGGDMAGDARAGAWVEEFPWVWWVDFRQAEGALVSGYGVLLGIGAIAALLLQCFLSGGVLEVLDSADRRFSVTRFCEGGAGRVPSFVVIAIVELAALYALHWGWNEKLWGDVLRRPLFDEALDERMALGWLWLFAGAFVVLFYFVRTAFDYARVSRVVQGGRIPFICILRGFLFLLWRRPFGALMLLALHGALHAAWIAAMTIALGYAQGTTGWWIAGGIALQQLLLVGRFGLRVAAYGSMLDLYRGSPKKGKRPKAEEEAPLPAAQAESLMDAEFEDLLGE
jgi:hypothetical protein